MVKDQFWLEVMFETLITSFVWIFFFFGDCVNFMLFVVVLYSVMNFYKLTM